MAWPVWSKGLEKALAGYALPELAARVRLAEGRDDVLSRPNGYKRLVELIYDALKAKGMRYASEEYDPEAEQQRIRDPVLMLEGGGEGTCLDLALLFAGTCLGNECLPVVVIVRGHAFVAVSLNRGRRQADARARHGEDGEWVGDGLLKDGGETLRSLIERGDWLAIECTGFARAGSETLPESLPEGAGRKDGLMSFERACEAGREQLLRADRPFRFAVDVAVLQDLRKIPIWEPPSRSLEKLQPNLRLRLARLFESHRLFGGRDAELKWLDDCIQQRPSDCWSRRCWTTSTARAAACRNTSAFTPRIRTGSTAIARTLGLSVSTDMPNAVLDLMKLYPQPVRAQSAGGVEYLPVPRQGEPAGREA